MQNRLSLGADLGFCQEGGHTDMRGDCKSVKHTLRSAKHKLSRGVWGHAPQENFQNYLFETCHLLQISLYISLNMKTGYN